MDKKQRLAAEKALKRAIRLAGGARPLAARLSITRQAVESWVVAPATRAARIEAETGVQRVELRPDIFG
jgi:DNA-binding transcriptional regulator YdaS (Cro superfamily)